MAGGSGGHCSTPPPPPSQPPPQPPPAPPPAPSMIQYAAPPSTITTHPPVYGKPYIGGPTNIQQPHNNMITQPEVAAAASTTHQSREMISKRYAGAQANNSCLSTRHHPLSSTVGHNNPSAALLGSAYTYLQS